MTPIEIKEKVVLHLQKFLTDETLGLVDVGPERPGETIKKIDPKDSDRVFVDVTAFNSKNYYVQGAVLVPGRLPVTGHETVLDAINFAGGLTPQADHAKVVLYRQVTGRRYRPYPSISIRSRWATTRRPIISSSPATGWSSPSSRSTEPESEEPALERAVGSCRDRRPDDRRDFVRRPRRADPPLDEEVSGRPNRRPRQPARRGAAPGRGRAEARYDPGGAQVAGALMSPDRSRPGGIDTSAGARSLRRRASDTLDEIHSRSGPRFRSPRRRRPKSSPAGSAPGLTSPLEHARP